MLYYKIFKDIDIDNDVNYDEAYERASRSITFSGMMQDCRMLGTDENTEIEYGFVVKGVEGKYKVVFNDSIISEELYYTIGSRRGRLFSISKNNKGINKKINNSVFKNQKYRSDFNDMLDKYWGKQTLLSILINQLFTQNVAYGKENVSDNILVVLFQLAYFYISSNLSDKYQMGHEINNGKFTLIDLTHGTVPKKEEDKLDFCEKIINEYMTQLYPDIHKAYYDKRVKGKKIEYELYLKKLIAGSIREIPFDAESTGTKKILDIIRALIAAMNGATVIYDEIDTGVHDMLMENVIQSALKYIKGQLIITTHNTMLLETIDPKSIYVIYVDYKGNKEARCLSDYDIRIQGHNNVRDMYLKGLFGGIPYTKRIDCGSIIDYFRNSNDKDQMDEEEKN
jgi:hypothetical protein